MANAPQKVLFVCTGNSCRSIMAEMLLNHLGERRYEVFSAGSCPKGQVHPQSIATLTRHGIDPGQPRSQSWEEFTEINFDLVITVCDQAAGETCPLFPSNPQMLHWSIPDPAKATGTEEEINRAFDEAFHLLKTCIEKEFFP
ncbi:MAG: arsenate reductase [Nitrospirales bacterium]|nr:MAG: arsenate reductase [Nitrospirales bacterium]